MTGWCVGYAYGPRWIIDPMTKVVSHCTSCTPSVSQRAALRMDPAVVENMARRFAARSEFLYEALSRLPGFRVNKPAGSFYMFPDVSQLTDDTYRFALDLLQEERVAVVPGFPFRPSGVGCFRLACTVGRDKIAKAVTRIERFVTRRLNGRLSHQATDMDTVRGERERCGDTVTARCERGSSRCRTRLLRAISRLLHPYTPLSPPLRVPASPRRSVPLSPCLQLNSIAGWTGRWSRHVDPRSFNQANSIGYRAW
jgi:hypothetical protein